MMTTRTMTTTTDNDDDNDDDDDSLEDKVKAATKLDDLKEICADNADEFGKLAKKKALKKFKGLEGVRELKAKMCKKLGIVIEKKAPAKKGPKKPGVIATIVTLISSKPMSKKKLLKELVKAFPDRDADKMEKTLNIQVPNRIRKEKNESLTENKKGKWLFKKTVGDIKKTK